MKICTALLAALLLAHQIASATDATTGQATKADAASREKLVSSLISQMTLEEKIKQLQSFNRNDVPRLGIPNLNVCEALHGVVAPGATAFPQAIALAATWDPELIERAASVTAKEARALGKHQSFGPMLALAQDARWGRVEESFGEDPFLVSRMGVATILGLQGRGSERLDRNHIIATAKHFAADGQPMSGQNAGSFEISERLLRETHLLPFEAAVKEAHVASIMPAHHSLNGVPCHGNPWLLEDVLRKEWGFDGYIVSDFGDLHNLGTGSENKNPKYPHIQVQRVVDTPDQSALLGLQSGVDTELAGGEWGDSERVYAKTLLDAVQAGKIPLSLVERSDARVLRAKLELNLSPTAPEKAVMTNAPPRNATPRNAEPDQGNGAGDLWGTLVKNGTLGTDGMPLPDAQKILNDPSHDELALEVAQKAIVLLKNEGGLLPLPKDKGLKIAVVGPLAQLMNLGGYATPKPKFYVTVVDGIKAVFGTNTQVTFEPGCELANDSDKLLPAAVESARNADVVVAVVGTTREQLGENLDRDNLDLVGGQEKLVEAVHATGKPTVVILENGGPLSIPWIKTNIPAIVEGWYLGQASGTALAQVLDGEINPGGKLPVTFPVNAGRCPCYYYRFPAGRVMHYYNSPEANLFPFGYGLSYTTFAYSNLQVSPDDLQSGQTATVSVKVTNTGSRSGDEVVQLYLRDDVSSLVRPAMELRGFRRITLAPGASQTLKFPVGFEQLRFWKDHHWVVEPGTFTVMVGSSSEDIRLRQSLKVSGTQHKKR